MKRIRSIFLALLMSLTMATGMVALPALASADSASKTDACSGLSQLDASQGCGSDASKNVVGNLAGTIVTVLSIIIGIAAVIMIIIAGLRFITANGDSNGIASAKTSLIYALVGLLIATLAQFLVHFVLGKFNDAGVITLVHLSLL